MSKYVVTGLKACPKCDYDAIFVPLVPAVGYDGKLYGSKSEGFCNSPFCDQLFWYYPRSGRVTRRMVGMTLKEYQGRSSDLRIFNLIRRSNGLSEVMEVPTYDDVPVTPYEPPLSLFARLRRTAVEWYWWIVAALKSPFLGKLPSSSLVDAAAFKALKSGDKSINDVRREQGFDSMESDD